MSFPRSQGISKQAPNGKRYKYTLDNITPEDFGFVGYNNSAGGLFPITFPEFVNSMDLLLSDMDILASRSEEWKRTIQKYKERCEATITLCIKRDPKLALEYYKMVYGNTHTEGTNEPYENSD